MTLATESQQQPDALVAFKDALEKSGLFRPKSEKQRASHDDTVLL